MKTTRRNRATRALVALSIAALVAAGCGDDDDTPEAVPQTTASTTTTSTTTSTTTTTRPASDEEQIREVIGEFETFFDRSGNPPDPSSPLIGELLADPLRTRIAERYTSEVAAGGRYEGVLRFDVRSVAVDADRALVLACGLDATTYIPGDGSEAIPPATTSYEYELDVVRTADGWRVGSFTKIEDQPCTLS